MKTIAGACLRAVSNSLRMREAPSPANISTKAEAGCEKKAAPDSAATALASSVLPVPGGPCSSTPRGTRAPRRSKRAGSRRNSMISASSALASSTPATSCQRTIDSSSGLSSAGAVRGIIFTSRHIRYTRNPSRSGGIQRMMKRRI